MVERLDQVINEGIVICIEIHAEHMLKKGEIRSFNVSKDILKVIENPLDEFKTEHKNFCYFSEKLSYIEPKEIVVGQK